LSLKRKFGAAGGDRTHDPWLQRPVSGDPDEVGDIHNLGMWLDVNGERMQTGSTKTMIFDCAKIIS
jgi:2-keto-4-pentenoate hydratase/2-oxohepta-3-ene-1,7-dioic acid hydratase in catechol pathway